MFGVSALLRKGFSGGPCIVLDGVEAGGIIGLGKGHLLSSISIILTSALIIVHGYNQLSDPYNLVNGFPVGLKTAIKQMSTWGAWSAG